MKKDLRQLTARIAALILIPIVLGMGCFSATGPNTGTAGGNPAAPPTPPSEIPAALRFPETISEISVVALVNPGSVPAALKIGDNVSGAIEDNVLSTIFFYDLVDDFLEPLHQLVIPVTLNNRFEGLIISGSNLINVKMDFSDFDGRGCSGHTAALPICYRIWFNGQRRLFGQFDAFPSDANSGAGDLNGTVTSALLLGAPIDVALQYDFQDPLTKNVDIALQVPASETEMTVARIALEQVPSGDSFLKTFRSTGDNPSDGLKEQVSRWIDAENYWSGTRDAETGDPNFNFEAACAVISTGVVVERENCLERGIDVGDLDPLAAAESLGIRLPIGFPYGADVLEPVHQPAA